MQWRGFLMPGIRTPYSVFCDLTHGYNFSGKNKCNHWHLHKTYTSGEEKNVKNGMCLEFNVQNLFSWQWLCLDSDKDWCLRKVELKIARTHIEQITAKAVIHSGGNVMMTWWQQNFKQITMCLKPLWRCFGSVFVLKASLNYCKDLSRRSEKKTVLLQPV